MSDLLRIYTPGECDRSGVPLDWERCQMCIGKGQVFAVGKGDFSTAGDVGPEVCAVCGGHGSLKAAGLQVSRGIYIYDPSPPRCEDCAHPMSEGTFEPELSEGQRSAPAERHMFKHALMHLTDGVGTGVPREPPGPVFYSPCDDGCKHAGPGRYFDPDFGDYHEVEEVSQTWSYGRVREASWRQVDVRLLSWPHDLRREQLAILCLRCFAERGRA